MIPSINAVMPAITQPLSWLTPPRYSLRKVLMITGVVSLTGLSLTSSALAGPVVAGVMTVGGIRQLSSRKIDQTTDNATLLSNSPHMASENAALIEQKIQAAEQKAAEEDWGAFEIPDDISDDHPTMISTSNWKADCLEEDPDQEILSVKPCTGIERQRFIIKEGVISTNAGNCLSPPDDSSILAITENNQIKQAANCSVKLIPCPEQPIKTRLISNMIHHKNYILTINHDSIICYLDKTSVKNFFNKEPDHYKHSTYFKLFSDWDHTINRCKYDKRTLEYPVNCENDNNKEFTIYERKSFIANKKFCNELIKPETHSTIPDIQDLPLEVPKDSRRIEHTLLFDGNFIPRSNPNGMVQYSKKYIFTGLYTAPGDIFKVKVTSRNSLDICKNALTGMELQVNMHTDDLSNNLWCYGDNENSFTRRPPLLHIKRPLYKGLNTIRSPYGGTIWITSPQTSSECKFKAEFSNIFHAPHYKLDEESPSWSINKTAAPPWSVLEGHRLTTVLPTTLAASLKNPKKTVELMDRMIDESLKLWGYSVDSPHPPRIHHPGNQNDILVDDIQIAAGDAHAGNDINQAIMVDHNYNPVELLDEITTDNSTLKRLTLTELFHLSIIPHEVGHHLHPHKLLTPLHNQVIAELTAEYVNERLFGLSLIADSCAYRNAFNKTINQNLNYSAYPMDTQTDFQAAAVFFREIIDAFPNKGWNIFSSMAKHYRTMKPEDAKQLISESLQHQTDFFFELLCNITHHNLANHFKAWKIPISESIESKVSLMPMVDQSKSILQQKNRRLYPKIDNKDAPECHRPIRLTQFSESQQEILYTAAFLAIAYGFYLAGGAGKPNKQECNKIKKV